MTFYRLDATLEYKRKVLTQPINSLLSTGANYSVFAPISQ